VIYYWLTRSVNADIGEACWRRGAFVDFSVTGLDEMGRNGTSRNSREKEGRGGGFWERVHGLNRFVRDMVEKMKTWLFFHAILPITLIINLRFVDINRLRSRYFFLFLFLAHTRGSVSFRSAINI